MATTFKWTAPEAIVTLESTSLNSLANSTSESTGKVLSSAIDNETDLFQLLNVEVSLASITTGSGSPYIGIWLLFAPDGTNYETGSTTIDPPKAQHIIVPLKASYTGVQLVTIENIPIPPLKFKALHQNKAGAALASSGNTIKYRRHNSQGV